MEISPGGPIQQDIRPDSLITNGRVISMRNFTSYLSTPTHVFANAGLVAPGQHKVLDRVSMNKENSLFREALEFTLLQSA